MDEDTKKYVKDMAFLSSMGMAIALSIAIGVFLGYWVDEKFGTSPWFFYIGLGLGIGAAFRNLIYLYQKAKRL